MSFWRSEVERLQQGDKKEKHLLTCQRFTETRTFTCNMRVDHFELLSPLSFISVIVVMKKKSDYNISVIRVHLFQDQNKSQLSQTDPRDALPHVHLVRLYRKVNV